MHRDLRWTRQVGRPSHSSPVTSDGGRGAIGANTNYTTASCHLSYQQHQPPPGTEPHPFANKGPHRISPAPGSLVERGARLPGSQAPCAGASPVSQAKGKGLWLGPIGRRWETLSVRGTCLSSQSQFAESCPREQRPREPPTSTTARSSSSGLSPWGVGE